MDMNAIERTLLEATRATRGHFRYESGHHGDLWLELEPLFNDARRLRNWASALAVLTTASRPKVVCGPLTGGAFVAQFVAAEIGADFVFAERHVEAAGAVRYRIPPSLRATLRDRRMLLVDDAVNAGSALLSTLADATDCGAILAGFASLLSLGDAASRISAQAGAPFAALVSLERRMWLPADCPLCRGGEALVDPL